ncbi:uncharacterized protein LOC113169500 isoform X3 [Anabas testudineus]|uniref:uncharacterized protein LOC113169500 isoform X3 n=1 Tax=Anabas testudineus TaxID=64144 RepID=UPI000E4628C9|nr:uncharacterized protein LOC113169500 isoform X3 [Anabas testudineus]
MAQGKDLLYKDLEENEPRLINDLKTTEHENVMDKVKVETLAIKKLLIETLNDLSFKKFWSLLELEKDFSLISRSRLKVTNTRDVVELIMETFGQESVEVTKKVLKKMNRTDLVQRLSVTEEKQWPTMIQRVEKMASDIELLLETLAELSNWELEKLNHELLSPIHCDDDDDGFSENMLVSHNMTNKEDIVFLMVKVFGQQSVMKTEKVLKKMRRTDLIQRLSVRGSAWKKKHSVDENQCELIQKVAMMAAVKEVLLETLSYLSSKELMKFRWFVQFTCFQKGLPLIPWRQLEWKNSAEIVNLMMETHGQRSVEVTTEVLMDMNRTDLVQCLSDTSSGLKKLPAETSKEEERCPALIQKVEMMVAVLDLLLETLGDFNESNISDFKREIYQCRPYYDYRLLTITDVEDTVFFMVEMYGQQSVEMTKDVLEKIKRKDLVKRLSCSSSAPRKKHPMDEQPSALIHKVATMAAVKQLLLEILDDLGEEDLNKFHEFLQWTVFQGDFSEAWWRHKGDNTKTVTLMMEIFGQKSVEVTKKICMDSKTTGLEELLSEIFFSSGRGVKHCLYNQGPALFMGRPATCDVKEILFYLSDRELATFKWLLQFMYFQKGFPQIPCDKQDRQTLMNLMVERHDQRCLEVIREILKDMDRADLVKHLPETSLEPKGKRHPKQVLQDIIGFPIIQRDRVVVGYREDDVKLIVERYSHQSETEQTTDISAEMMDFVEEQKSSVITSGSREKQWIGSTDHHSALHQDDMNRTKVTQSSLESSSTLNDSATSFDLSAWKGIYIKPFYLQLLGSPMGRRMRFSEAYYDVVLYCKMNSASLALHVYVIPHHLFILQEVHKRELSNGYVEVQLSHSAMSLKIKSSFSRYGRNFHGFEVTVENPDGVFNLSLQRESITLWTSVIQKGRRIKKKDEKINSTSEACERVLQDPSHWTKLDPDVNRMQTDKTPTYSLQSEAGNFECSVSSLRWICKDKVTFKYQFCSWEEPMERMESMQYMPAGSLIDITVIAGKLDEVYLPHWICIEDNPTILDKFAVLHIEDCGDVVETVSGVTSSHVKLSEPVFSPRAVLMKVGFPVKINCNVLLYYKPNTTFLKLHVYLIPHDPALQQAVDEKEFSKGYEIIHKPRPDKYLKMQDSFNLSAKPDTARIQPEKITLRYDSQDPNFYEVFIENPDKNFCLTLSSNCRKKAEPVWTCEIRKDDYSNPGLLKESDEHRSSLVQKAETKTPVSEKLLEMLEQLTQEEFEKFKWYLYK